MYRVVIVDDEPWVLKGIRSTFAWHDYGFEVVAETTDSEQAWELIRQEKPDAVLTDIRMPELSGIDLMRLSREEGIDAAFVLISGVADFQYAKESIRLGCFDYLLKPLQFDEADAVLKRLGEHLQASFRQRQKALQAVLLQGTQEQLEQQLKNQGFEWKGREVQVLQMKAASEDALAAAETWLAHTSRFTLRPESNQAIIITGCEQSLYPMLSAKLQEAGAQTGIFIGISSRSARVEEMAERVEEARQALQSSFLFPEGGVFLYRKESLPVLRKTVHELCSDLRQSSGALLAPRFESLHELFRREQAGIKDVVYFWNQMVSTLHNPLGEGGLRQELQFMDPGELTERFADFGQMCSYLKRQALPEAKPQDHEMNLLINENFSKLLDYVNQHYMEELHLKELSHQFYINYTYCCDLFQKVTKSTFTDYMTRLRMKKAELLLRERSLTIVEICQKVGYKDYTYFNKVFKKWYGLTPSNYRKSKALN